MTLKLALAFVILFALKSPAQFSFTTLDASTPTTNSVSSQGSITVTNLAAVYVAGVTRITNASGVVTNFTLTLGTNWFYNNTYFSYRTGVVQYGDAPVTATYKINQNFTNASLAFSALNNTLTNYIVTNSGGGGGGVLTNSVLSSRQYTLFSSNYWTFGTSNYVGRFTNGWTSISFNGGQAGGGGLSFPTNVFEQIWASTNGTSGWFVMTNYHNVTNTYSLAVVGAGGGLGSILIQTVDHPEYINRTNGFYGQFTQFSDPLTPQDAATKNYVDLTEQNMVAGQWQNSSDTNGYFHQVVSHYGGVAFDIGFPTVTLYNSLSLDGTGTNLLLAIPQTNLPAAFVISSSTNLSLLNGWTTFTNYTSATNAGVVTFTIPIYPSQPQLFLWPRTAATPTANLYAPLTIGSAFSLWVQTNTPTISDLGNQKGGRMWCSNGFFYLTGSTNASTTYTKQLAP